MLPGLRDPEGRVRSLICGRPFIGRSQAGGAGFISILLILLIITAGIYYYKTTKTGEVEDLSALPVAELDPAQTLEFKADDAPVIIEETTENGATDPAIHEAAKAYKEGDYERAIVLLREALGRSPGSDVVKSALARSINRASLDLYNGGDYSGARQMLIEAVALAPDETILENLVNVQIRLDDLRGAASTIERVGVKAENKKTLYNIYIRLGRQRLDAGDPSSALEYYEKASAIDSHDQGLMAAIASLEKETSVEAGMGATDNRHFVVKFDGGENAVAGHLIGILLEEAYSKVGADLNFYPEERIEAVLYSRENFRDITRSPSWAGAIYDGRIKVPAGGVTEKTQALEAVLFHEYTHAIVHRLSAGRAPVWLNEGIAQYEEGRTSSSYSTELGEAASAGALRLRALEGSFMGLSSQSAQGAYLVSLSATEYIIREFGLFSVRKILENIGSGMSTPEAISAAIYLSYDDLEKSWVESLKR
ncbi:MAG: hypothetical protein AABY51_06640 [Deltaproteobacteria bacterium]